MYYVYVLWSAKSKIFYTGYTTDLKRRILEHNDKQSLATKAHSPWELVFYCAFKDKYLAENFEKYLKTGSGKAFLYKRLINAALKMGLSTPKL
jgi:putative endonuclease